jgi:polyisoprenyl-teichoic acid--peptidoglycan teichoic acid transferase
MFTRYKKFNPDGSGGFAAKEVPEVPRPTKGQYAIEITLFTVFGIVLVLAGVAFYTSNSKEYKVVPNLVAEGVKQDRINLLVFGVGGENHPSKDELADAIMLVSLKPSTKQAAVVSIPRDLWVNLGTYGSHRLNYAHLIGNGTGYPGSGPGLLTDTVAKIFDQPIHAYVRVDFDAFEKIIDAVGGIDVYCQRPFYDFLFKDGFPKGPLHLNGKRALAYARYRYINGPEGDNFAREMRQQQVVNALRDKLQRADSQTVLRLIAAIPSLSESTRTNLTTPQMISLYRTFRETDPKSVRHVSLKPLTTIFEVRRLTEPGEAVRPRAGDYREFQAVEKNIFSANTRVLTAADRIRFAASPAAPRPQPVALTD